MRLAVKLSLLIVMLLVFPCRILSQGNVEDVFLAPGNITGYVFNYYGLAISGATVGLQDGPVTTSGADGYYFLEGITDGDQNVGCGKAGYNASWIIVNVVSGDTSYQNFTLTQPAMVINPLLIEETINPGEYFTTSLNVLNSGSGPLGWQAGINYISMPPIPCNYSIALYDTWGDGWSGCSIDVLVNDSVVLDNITLSSGSGPVYFYFPIFAGDQITTDFNPGSFVTEPYYYIYDGEGTQVWFSPAGNNGPPDILPGQLNAVCNGGEWLTMDYNEDTVPPFGGVANIPTHLNAAGTASGDVYNANIVFTSTPFVGEITIPVTMTIQGNEIAAPENLQVELIDDVIGKVELTWDWNGDSFQFFVIKRDGMIIATTTGQSFIDILKDHGLYCYTVQAFYNEGSTSPAGPLCVEWPNPILQVDPGDIEGWVWTGFTVDVFTTVSNQGEGTLAYSFPAFAALDLLNNQSIEKNKPGSPPESQSANVQKGDDRYDGGGYPIVLGAGGPDDFGYVWIDSDEPGGPAFSFIDISTTGTPVFGLSDDNIVGPFNVGFDFYFYGEIKNRYWINSNGCIGFTSNYITIQNTTLPTNSAVYNDFIAWMWDDLVFKQGVSQVYFKIFQDKLIIQFKNYEHWGQPNLFINAEVVLYQNGRIMVIYDNFTAGITLNSCTIGMQSSDPAVGLQIAFNTTYLHNDLALLCIFPADFIADVEPSSGIVTEGGSQVITITYDSQDYAPGPYTQELLLESNDHSNEEYVIDNTMNVYLPAIYSGIVYDNDNDDPLNGVLVTAGPFQASTGEDGEYTLYVDEGSYDVTFEKLGYMPVSVRDTAALQDMITTVNMGMWDMNYPPAFVHAEVMDDDAWCEITWALPQGPYEIIMDDGEADDFFVFAHAGSWHAVKFTPAGYPATVIGGKFYVGDGSFPGPFLGTDFGVAVFDDDGVNGLPGTMLDSNGVTVNNSGWVIMDWLNASISDGSFYLAMYQAGNAPLAAPIGVDTDSPTHFKSYSKFLANDWSLSPFQDFMIRAWINGPASDDLAENAGKVWKAIPKAPANWQKYASTRSGTLPQILPGYELNKVIYKGVEGMSNRDVLNYRVARYTGFDPNGPPSAGTIYELANTGNLYYNELTWEAFTPGWYAYGVKAHYTSGQYSDYTVSNIVGHRMDCHVSVNVSLTGGEEADNVEVTLQGLEYPYETFYAVTPSNGSVEFNMVWKGHYNITIFKIGYDVYSIENTSINDDKVFNIILSEKKYPPTCFVVDPLSLKATWCEPLITALYEDFEDPVFPPAGWESTLCDTTAWVRTDDGSNSSWTIPAWDSFYAVYLDGSAGSDCNGCCEYLVMPPVDLRESEDYVLSFDSFYDGAFGQLAFVEYSIDSGAVWEVMSQLMPAIEWTKRELDLTAFGGPEGFEKIWFAFHADASGSWASGWAIDNVAIQVPSSAANYLDFSVFLNDAYVGSTTETSWDFAPLAYGQTYTACVAARYSSGLSSKDYDTFTSVYLFPPQNLTGTAPDDAAILTWNPPGIDVPYNLLGYNIYRDDIFINYLPHIGEWEPQGFVEENLDPGIYSYTVTGVYDLAPYGLPGETGESMEDGPGIVTVDYCNELEFIETWQLGSYNENGWTIDGINWSINAQAGNPPPVAEFTWNPVQTDYEISLESYPLCAVGMTEGSIWLSFDLSLFSIQTTGDEKLLIQVWGWDTQVWNTVAEYSNAEGSFDWISPHIDIRPDAMNKVFKIRFMATGLNSADIRGWFLDNVHVYRTCTAPQELTIDPSFDEGIRLTWQLPEYGNNKGGDGTRELTAINVYRSVDGGDYEYLGFAGNENEYVDPGNNLVMGSMYCYKVTADWESESDHCESPFSDEVCVLYTGIVDNHVDKGNIDIYPNPANDFVNISASEVLNRIEVYNSSGCLIFDKTITGMQYGLNTAAYPAGVYLVRVETATANPTRLLTIQR